MRKKIASSILTISVQSLCFLIFATSGRADSAKDIDELVELIKATGTKVLTSSNCEAKISGYYLPPNKEGSGDKLVFCTNNINLKDASAAWEVLAHESTHVMQACNGGQIWKEIYHPRLLRGLKEQAPHYAEILSQYKGDDKLMELEAFDMELRTAGEVKALFVSICQKPSPNKTSNSNDNDLASGIFEVVGGRNSFMELMAWASKNLRPNQLQQLNEIIASGNIGEIKSSLSALQALYNKSRSYENYRLF